MPTETSNRFLVMWCSHGKSPKTGGWGRWGKAVKVKFVCALDILIFSAAFIKAFGNGIMLNLTFFADRNKLITHEI